MPIYLVLLFAKFIFTKTNARLLSQTYDRLSFQEATESYIDSHFLSSHSVYPISFTSTGDKPGYSIDFAFQDDSNYWISNLPSTNDFHSAINVTFSEPTLIEAFLLSASYQSDSSTQTRVYHGFPTKLKVYIAMDDNDEFILNTIFSGTPVFPLDKAQFVFKNPVKCKRLQLEFTEVTEDTLNSKGERVTNIRFLNFIKKLDHNNKRFSPPSGKYASNVYKDFHKIATDQFDAIPSSTRDKYPISNAFDDKDGTYWIAGTLSDIQSTSHIIIEFKKPTLFEGFLFKGKFDAGFWGIGDKYQGMPTKIDLYVSNSSDEYVLNTGFSGEPSDKKDLYQFILSEKVLCDKVKIEFVDVVNDDSITKSKTIIVDQLTLLQGYENEGLISQGVVGNYVDSGYLETRTVPSSEFSLTATGGSQAGHDITTETIDNNEKTYWVSQEANSPTFKNSVIVDFKNPVLLEAVLIDPVYKTSNGVPILSGFPTRLKIYSSLNDDEELSLISYFVGTPYDSNTRTQFVFPNKVSVKKLKLEFIEVTPFVFESDGSLYAGVANFIFIQESKGVEVITYHENKGYDEFKIIPKSKFKNFTSNGDNSKGPVSNLFDDDDSSDSYWQSSFKNDDTHHAIVTVNFMQSIRLDEILLGAYKGFGSNNYGFPTRLNIFASNDDNEELKLKATFQGQPGDPSIYQLTLREPICCTRLEIEVVSVYSKEACLNFMKFIGEVIDFSGDNMQDDFTTQLVNNNYPLHGIDDTHFVINDLPNDNDYLFIVEKKFYFNNVSFICPDALMSAIKSNHSSQVTVKQCKFNRCSVKSDIGNGGAIFSINCVLNCESSHFTNCHSKINGGGGGIFLVLNEKVNQEVSIMNCNFSDCSATFGGAVYLYSNLNTNKVIVQKCVFTSNSLIESSSADSLSGGSAIYVNALRAVVKKCQFTKNSRFSSMKIDTSIDNVYSHFLSGSFFGRPVISIESCDFEIDSSSQASISYLRGNKKTADTVVSDCIFKGQLLDDAHHIVVDSASNSNEAGKTRLNVKSCKFACDKLKSINVNFDDSSSSIVVFNVSNQVYNYDESKQKENESNESKSKSLFITTMSLTVIAIFVVIGVASIVSMRKSEIEANDDKNDPLNHPLDSTDL